MPDTTQVPTAVVPVVDPFLKYARRAPSPVQTGTLAAGDAGGAATSFLTWNPGEVPPVPGWCDSIDLIFSLPVSCVAAAGKTATMSPLAPYSAFAAQMVIAGSPEWPANTSLVPWWLDEITSMSSGFDPYKIGPTLLTTNQIPNDISTQFDSGASGPTFAAGADTVLPGGTFTNSTKHIIIRGAVRIQLQRLRTKMWGMIPFGDPQNRPVLKVQLNALVGVNPENNLFIQDTSGSGVTATVDTGGVTMYAVYNNRSLDVLPGSVTTLPTPQVGLGLNVNYNNSWTIANANAIVQYQHRTAMIYTNIHQILINGALPIRPDYWGLWLTGDQQSARWAYDAGQGNFQDYYADVLRRYGRYVPRGHMIADFVGGDFPDVPRETPYNALMSPDVGYASTAGVAATPNMTTNIRVPAGTSMSSAYVATYSLGLVRVPY